MARSAAANKPAKSAKAGAKPGAAKRRGNRGILTLSVVLLTAMAVTALPLCILFLVGLPPTAVAIIVDRHQRRYLARTVGAMNLSGVLPSAFRLWEAGLSFPSLGHVVGNPYAWLLMYGAAGLGWLLYFGMPRLVGLIVEIRAEDQKRQLEARVKALVTEWGEEVTGRTEETAPEISSAAGAGRAPTP